MQGFDIIECSIPSELSIPEYRKARHMPTHRTAPIPGLVIAAIVTAAAILALVCMPSATHAATRCAEDDPCWTWSTMGDLQRGVHVRNTPRAIHIGTRRIGSPRQWRVVSPCEFAFLAHEGLLTSKTTPLKGDLFAERHGCDYRLYA